MGENLFHWSRVYGLNVSSVVLMHMARVKTTGAYGAVFGFKQKLMKKPLLLWEMVSKKGFLYVLTWLRLFIK